MKARPMKFLLLSAASLLAACGTPDQSSSTPQAVKHAECRVYPKSKDFEDPQFHVKSVVVGGIPEACAAAKAQCSAQYGEECWLLGARTWLQ